jgi:lipopolysaccharide biosynthesis glycosyltransferase
MGSDPMTSAAIVLAFDERYAMPGMVAITSIAHKGAVGGTPVIVLDCGLSSGSLASLEVLAANLQMDIEVRDASRAMAAVRGYPVASYVNASTWVRLHVAGLCSEFQRVLYLDADTLCRRSLQPVLTADLRSHIVGAVQDVFHPTLGTPVCLPGITFSGTVRKRPYFNAGVMLIDVEAWSEESLTARLADFVERHPRSLRFWDQDALNGVLLGDWLDLGPTWNVPPISDILGAFSFDYFGASRLHRRDFAHLERTAAIVHYITGLKPWHSRFPAGAMRDLYREAWSVTAGMTMTPRVVVERRDLRWVDGGTQPQKMPVGSSSISLMSSSSLGIGSTMS